MEIEIWVYPVTVRIWKQGVHYYAVVTDPLAIETLMPHVGRDVTIELAGLEFTARLRRLQQRSTYVGVELPSRLNITWAKMWAEGKSRKMLIKIIGNGKPAPEEPKLGGAA